MNQLLRSDQRRHRYDYAYAQADQRLPCSHPILARRNQDIEIINVNNMYCYAFRHSLNFDSITNNTPVQYAAISHGCKRDNFQLKKLYFSYFRSKHQVANNKGPERLYMSTVRSKLFLYASVERFGSYCPRLQYTRVTGSCTLH